MPRRFGGTREIDAVKDARWINEKIGSVAWWRKGKERLDEDKRHRSGCLEGAALGGFGAGSSSCSVVHPCSRIASFFALDISTCQQTKQTRRKEAGKILLYISYVSLRLFLTLDLHH